MSALFWIFGLGTAAIAFPFLFHLIRRTPKGQTPFSSLMFLKPSPPNLTRRSRIENWLLLLMRMAALLLIVLAFMRPFLRGTDRFSSDRVANRRIAILVDTSASMRRGDLWQQAERRVAEALSELEPDDSVALVSFDDHVRWQVPFEEIANTNFQVATKSISDSFKTLRPNWARSDLGKALVIVADQMTFWRDQRRKEDSLANAKLQIVVVSDLQQGSLTDRLQSYRWPTEVLVEFRSVKQDSNGNATVQILPANEEGDEVQGLRARVSNSADSGQDQFFVNYQTPNQNPTAQPIPFYVPAGSSQILELDRDLTRSVQQFVLTGDTEHFDNTYYVVPEQKQELQVAYFGTDDPDNPEQMQFYLARGLTDSENRSISIVTPDDDQPLFFRANELQSNESQFNEPLKQSKPSTAAAPALKISLAVVTSAVDEKTADQIEGYLASGGTVLVVLKDQQTVDSTARWTKANTIAKATDRPDDRNHYAMLAEIDFTHPLFAPFNSPRFNDFTTIRFWNYQRIELSDADKEDLKTKIIARFDDHTPAIWQHRTSTGGTIIALASGWHPHDSQLALSTKFVPILNGIVDIALAQPDFNRSYLVNEPFQFAPHSKLRTITKPDQSKVSIEAGQIQFDETDLVGIYRLMSDDGEQSFAVNIDRAESETEPIPMDQLEMLSVNIGRQTTVASDIEKLTQLRDRELEDRQKMWKWLIVSAVIMLIAETWLAGRTARAPRATNDDNDYSRVVSSVEGMSK